MEGGDQVRIQRELGEAGWDCWDTMRGEESSYPSSVHSTAEFESPCYVLPPKAYGSW